MIKSIWTYECSISVTYAIFFCDETRLFHIEFKDGHKRKVCMLLCVSVITRKLYIMHMEAQDLPSLFQALEMLLFCHGTVNLILDQHKMCIALGYRP